MSLEPKNRIPAEHVLYEKRTTILEELLELYLTGSAISDPRCYPSVLGGYNVLR
jgi:hypothetical protein